MRLIDADIVKKRMEETMDMQDLYLPVHFMQLLNEQDRIDAVPVVRCEECRFRGRHFWSTPGGCPIDVDSWIELDGFFCANGKRREDESEKEAAEAWNRRE